MAGLPLFLFLLTAREGPLSTELAYVARSLNPLAAVILPGAAPSCAPTTKPARHPSSKSALLRPSWTGVNRLCAEHPELPVAEPTGADIWGYGSGNWS